VSVSLGELLLRLRLLTYSFSESCTTGQNDTTWNDRRTLN